MDNELEKSSGTVRTDDGAELYYEVCGEGQPLVLLHGNGESTRRFRKVLPALSREYRCIAMDTRGHGQSQRGNKPLDYATITEDILALFDALDLETAHLLGFSDGGNAALSFALIHAKRLRSLILVGANLSPSGVKLSVQTPFFFQYLGKLVKGLFSKKARLEREIWGLMIHHPHIPPEELMTVLCPALVLAGEKDMIKTKETKLIARQLPDAELCIMPGADHFLLSRKPEEAVEVLLPFLRKHADYTI